MRYEVTAADRAPLPDAWAREERYLKYREADRAQPYAAFFEATTEPVQPHVVEALVAGMAPPEYGYRVDEAADRLGRPGREDLETGWTRRDDGTVMVAVRTAMPGVTAAMWDWWFGWHGRETARYKLWYPDAHQFAALGDDRGADRSLTDRQRYVGNVSYVDEYLGGRLMRLAIRFLDPDRMGFEPTPGTTHVCARVGLSTRPVAFGWLVHQVRPTDDGCEMRSRFFLGDPEVLDLPSGGLPARAAVRSLTTPLGRAASGPLVRSAASALMPADVGSGLLYHCAAEMNHLGGFLPRLYDGFRDVP